jgi:hypothetical protein
MFATVCLKCFGLIPQKAEDDPVGSMTCTDCPHCGDHQCGARQMQLGEQCTREVKAEEERWAKKRAKQRLPPIW